MSSTTRRATRTAAASPSSANGTPASEGREPRTNVISGCTDATAAPRLRSDCQFIAGERAAGMQRDSSLPFDLRRERARRSGDFGVGHAEPNQVRPAQSDGSVNARAPTCFANLCAFLSEAPRDRAITASIA